MKGTNLRKFSGGLLTHSTVETNEAVYQLCVFLYEDYEDSTLNIYLVMVFARGSDECLFTRKVRSRASADKCHDDLQLICASGAFKVLKTVQGYSDGSDKETKSWFNRSRLLL